MIDDPVARHVNRKLTKKERATWYRIEPPRCDICDRVARWRHPDGGQRCNTCPRAA